MSSTEQERIERQKRLQEEQRASDAATQQASEMARRQMEETLHNPQFAEEIRDSDLEGKYDRDVGPETSKAHAVANLEESDNERIYWKTLNRAERRMVESKPGFLLKENPGLLAVAQDAIKDRDYQHADTAPLTSSEKRKMRSAYDVSRALKSLGVDGRGLDALTTATAEHRTVTNESEQQSGAKSRIRAFFD